MSRTTITNNNATKGFNFPSIYAPNSEKQSTEYALQMFRAVLKATSAYREERGKQIEISRMYAKGNQPLKQYLDELNIEGTNQYINISYIPTKILQKFEKIIVDDYAQLDEAVKVWAKGYAIQERRDRKKADLQFRMEFGGQIAELEQLVGFPLEDPEQQVPTDKEELDLILSLNPDEREEMILRETIDKVLNDNDIESKKKRFLSDVFQTNFGGYHVYTDRRGRIKVEYVSPEDCLYDSSKEELITDDVTYAGKQSTMTIGEIRDSFEISEDKEHLLYKLAYYYRTDYGNYSLIGNTFNPEWKYASVRPYDDYTVPVFHIWKKTLKNVGYLEGKDSYGKFVFDIDKDISVVEERSEGRKRTGVSYPETAYEGWFSGNEKCPVVLEWGEASNQFREGANKEKVICPYIFFMPDNRGSMLESSAVERLIGEIEQLDMSALKIKMAIAKHPPVGYALDVEALMDVDLGNGTLSPLDLDDIYQQTGKFYFKKRKEDGTVDNSPPIIPLNVSIADTINTYLTIYNQALNNIRDILGVNPNREGTANLSRVSTAVAQTQISISQTATYYIYRAFLKATERLVKLIGIRLIDLLKYGTPSKGYLAYLGQENIDFIKERDEIIATNYEFKFNAQMSKEDKERLDAAINVCLQAGTLTMADALDIWEIKDFDIASKYLRFLTKKNQEKAYQQEMERQQAQAQAQGDMAVRTEEAKRETYQIQSGLQAQEWKIKGETQIETQIYQLVHNALQALHEGKQISPREQEMINLVMDNSITKLEKSMVETEQQLQNQVQGEEQEAIIQQVQQAVQSGQITDTEGAQILQESGIQA